VTARPIRIGALISGGGRTVVNIARAIEGEDLPVEIGVIIAHREEVPGVARCRALGLPVRVLPKPPNDGSNRVPPLDDAIDAALEAAGIELVCLCGYLRHFRVGTRWAGRTINIHPALLPKFGGQGMYGDHVHAAVIAAGERESGCTIHVVDEEYDRGPILLQRRCPVLPGDDAHALASRVFDEETKAYPEVLRGFATGRWTLPFTLRPQAAPAG
jgi:formyltetrahydrofolate-dependent phosphoribosylglycinamide formyltransferase